MKFCCWQCVIVPISSMTRLCLTRAIQQIWIFRTSPPGAHRLICEATCHYDCLTLLSFWSRCVLGLLVILSWSTWPYRPYSNAGHWAYAMSTVNITWWWPLLLQVLTHTFAVLYYYFFNLYHLMLLIWLLVKQAQPMSKTVVLRLVLLLFQVKRPVWCVGTFLIFLIHMAMAQNFMSKWGGHQGPGAVSTGFGMVGMVVLVGCLSSNTLQ